MRRKIGLTMVAALLAVAPATAQDIDTRAGGGDAAGRSELGKYSHTFSVPYTSCSGTFVRTCSTYYNTYTNFYDYAVGQTFTTGAQTTLLDFSFWLTQAAGGHVPSFGAYIMAWNGTHAAGPVLYSSGSTYGTASTDPQQYQFQMDGAGLQLDPHTTYVAFLTSSGHMSSATWGDFRNAAVTVADGYDGGVLVTSTAYHSPPHDVRTWQQNGNMDAAFTATFAAAAPSTVTPEPVSLLLLGSGLAGLGVARRRRRSPDGDPG